MGFQSALSSVVGTATSALAAKKFIENQEKSIKQQEEQNNEIKKKELLDKYRSKIKNLEDLREYYKESEDSTNRDDFFMNPKSIQSLFTPGTDENKRLETSLGAMFPKDVRKDLNISDDDIYKAGVEGFRESKAYSGMNDDMKKRWEANESLENVISEVGKKSPIGKQLRKAETDSIDDSLKKTFGLNIASLLLNEGLGDEGIDVNNIELLENIKKMGKDLTENAKPARLPSTRFNQLQTLLTQVDKAKQGVITAASNIPQSKIMDMSRKGQLERELGNVARNVAKTTVDNNINQREIMTRNLATPMSGAFTRDES